jgi:hypothetical protein
MLFWDNELIDKVKAKLTAFVNWPCKMREARDEHEALAHKTYAESSVLIQDLPVVNVKTGKTSRFADR